MKTTTTIARTVLGAVFVIFGLNGFLQFIPMPPPTGLAAQFLGALAVSHYLVPIFVLQLVGGGLLLTNRFVPVALSLLGPVIVNILFFHAFLAPEGLPLAVVVFALWLVVFSSVRRVFAPLFAFRTPVPAAAKRVHSERGGHLLSAREQSA